MQVEVGTESDYVTPALLRWRERTDAPLLVLAIGSLPLLLLELDRNDLTAADRVFLDGTNLLVLVAFAVDYVVKLYLARPPGKFVRAEWASLLIVLAQVLALLPGTLSAFGILRIFRAGRAWRAVAVLARVVAIGGVAAREGRSVLRRHAARFALSFAAFTWLTAGVCFTLAELGPNDNVRSFFDGLWWASTTITTVGYGDIFPVTTAGRLVGVVTMGVGISAFAVVTAKVAEYLVRHNDDDEHSIDAVPEDEQTIS